MSDIRIRQIGTSGNVVSMTRGSITETYWAPKGGGVVKVLDGGELHRGFDPEAPVLVWDGREPLVNLIRLERVREHHRIYYQQNKGS